MVIGRSKGAFLLCVYVLVITLAGEQRASTAQETLVRRPVAEVPITGLTSKELISFDKMMAEFMEENDVPGASIAVTKDRKLVYARGFGYADLARGIPVQPTSLFRIASCSKPITAVAVLQLLDRGVLDLDAKVFPLLQLAPFVTNESKLDRRLAEITVRQALQHTAGWDRNASIDPTGQVRTIAKTMGIASPCHPTDIVRYMFGRPLDFDPGTRYVYSNFGYCVLGRLIEKKTDQRYDDYVSTNVLLPLDIRTMSVGSYRQAKHGEVMYYSHASTHPAGVFTPVFDKAGYIEVYEAHGGWVGSAVDLVRFAAALDDPKRCRILGPASIEAMFSCPSGPTGHDDQGNAKRKFYACGWQVNQYEKSRTTWHSGTLAGSSALLVRRRDGLNWAVLFNSRNNRNDETLWALVDPLVHRAAGETRQWPAEDLFTKFGMSTYLDDDSANQNTENKRNVNRQRPSPERKAIRQRMSPEQYRTWTDSTGKHSVEARFGGAAFGIVKLVKKDGAIVKLPIEELSQQDQQWIQERRR